MAEADAAAPGEPAHVSVIAAGNPRRVPVTDADHHIAPVMTVPLAAGRRQRRWHAAPAG